MDQFPKVLKIRQRFAAPRLEDVEAHVRHLLDRFGIPRKVRRGDRVGITAGSRGVRDKPRILRTLVEHLRDLGASPFVVPCMGSHGGATSEGQVDVLRTLGITEESVGAPILSSMEVQEIGKTRFGPPVVVDKNVCGMDHVIVVNRIKPHTDFRGEIESGLVKMMVIGMGKHRGALLAHQLTIKHGFPAVLDEIGSVILQRLPILFGIGILENPHHETADLELVEPQVFFEREKALLKRARELMPGLPFDPVDLLIVDELGKDISGTGMDTNVIGRLSFVGTPKPTRPRITRIFVRDLSRETHGNACGIGMADYTTKRLVEKIDFSSTNANCVTSMTPEDARIPIFFENDGEAVWTAYQTSGVLKPEEFRVLWIKNTLDLEQLFASETFLGEIREDSRLEIVAGPFDFPIGDDGNLISP